MEAYRENIGLNLGESSESVVEQPQESPSKIISRESAPQAGEDLPQPVPQLPSRRIEAPQPLAEPIPQARAPLAEKKPASPKRMREVTNVTENQIVQVPPGVNIFKNSDLIKDIKLAADMQEEEKDKAPVKEMVKQPKSFYAHIADELLE